MNPADLAAWNAANARARYAYALRTGQIEPPVRPCLVCGDGTTAAGRVHAECERSQRRASR